MYSRKFYKGTWLTVVCLGILFLFMSSIGIRLVARQVLVKKMSMSNAVIDMIFWDKPEMAAKDGIKPEDNGMVKIDWEAKYPFVDHVSESDHVVQQNMTLLDKYLGKVNGLKKKMTDYTEKNLAGQNTISSLGKYYGTLMQGGSLGPGVHNELVFLNNGYLTNTSARLAQGVNQNIAYSLGEFQDFLKQQGIGFLYINCGGKVDPKDPQMSASTMKLENMNNISDDLLQALAARGVDFMDMRQEIHGAGMDWYQCFYKMDHHWKTTTGLWAARVVADKLNRDYGFRYDMKYFKPESYQADTFEMVGGSHWKKAHRSMGYDGHEEYIRLLPRFETDFTMEIPSKSINIRGDYDSAVYDEKILEESQHYTEQEKMDKPSTYNAVKWDNAPLGILTNHLPVNNPKKLLVIQDSYGWYLTTYLACDTAQIMLVHPPAFTGSIRSLVREYKPDMVMLLCYYSNISPIDWQGHRSFFDMR